MNTDTLVGEPTNEEYCPSNNVGVLVRSVQEPVNKAGLSVKSLYDPENSVGFNSKSSYNPVNATVFNSVFCTKSESFTRSLKFAGIVGVSVKSLYDPENKSVTNAQLDRSIVPFETAFDN